MCHAVVIFVDMIQQMRPVEFRFILCRMHIVVLVFLRVSNGGPFGIGIVMPFAARHYDAIIHIETVDVKRCIKRVQDSRVIGITQVFSVKFAVL